MLWPISDIECELQRMSKSVAFDEKVKADSCINPYAANVEKIVS
jgi:hypothetical protein